MQWSNKISTFASTCFIELALIGCASAPIAPKIVAVERPIPCNETMPSYPVLPLKTLSPSATSAEMVQAYPETIVALEQDDLVLRTKLSACLTNSAAPAASTSPGSLNPTKGKK